LPPIHFKEETISLCHPESASFDAHIVLFEMYWGLPPPWHPATDFWENPLRPSQAQTH